MSVFSKHEPFFIFVMITCGFYVFMFLSICLIGSNISTDHEEIKAVLEDEGRECNIIRPGDGLNWFKFANHTHSEYSHDSDTPVWLLIWNAGNHGAQSIAITDHGTEEACNDTSFQTINGCTPMCGEEWGGGGHAGIINIDYGDPMEGWSVEDMIQETLSRGGTVIVNHPFDSGTPWSYAPYLHDGIGGIEIWNGPWVWTNNQSAVDWWQEILSQGRMVFGIAGSDVHYFPLNPLLPCNYVLAESSDPEHIQTGVDSRRITISMNESKSKLFLWCDRNLDGIYETVLGDNVLIKEKRKIRIKVEVFDGEGMNLSLISSNGKVFSKKVGGGNPYSFTLTVSVGPELKDFVRAELRFGILNQMMALTNPIFINY